MKIALVTLFYCGLMLYVGGFHGFGFLWFFCLFLVGPILVFSSVIFLAIAVKRRRLRPATVFSPLLCIIVVASWYFQFRRISHVLLPLVFATVAQENERLAISFMREQPPDAAVKVNGFRYPFYEIAPDGKLTVRHHAGVVSVSIPAGPSYAVFLVYMSPGSVMPYDPPNDDGLGWDATPIIEHWYYVRSVGI